jgi:hypothetical protein
VAEARGRYRLPRPRSGDCSLTTRARCRRAAGRHSPQGCRDDAPVVVGSRLHARSCRGGGRPRFHLAFPLPRRGGRWVRLHSRLHRGLRRIRRAGSDRRNSIRALVTRDAAAVGRRLGSTLRLLRHVGVGRLGRAHRRLPRGVLLHDDRRLGACVCRRLPSRSLRARNAGSGRAIPCVHGAVIASVAVAIRVLRARGSDVGPRRQSGCRIRESLARACAASALVGACGVLAGYRRCGPRPALCLRAGPVEADTFGGFGCGWASVLRARNQRRDHRRLRFLHAGGRTDRSKCCCGDRLDPDRVAALDPRDFPAHVPVRIGSGGGRRSRVSGAAGGLCGDAGGPSHRHVIFRAFSAGGVHPLHRTS